MSAECGANERYSSRIHQMQWFERTFEIPPAYSMHINSSQCASSIMIYAAICIPKKSSSQKHITQDSLSQ